MLEWADWTNWTGWTVGPATYGLLYWELVLLQPLIHLHAEAVMQALGPGSNLRVWYAKLLEASTRVLHIVVGACVWHRRVYLREI